MMMSFSTPFIYTQTLHGTAMFTDIGVVPGGVNGSAYLPVPDRSCLGYRHLHSSRPESSASSSAVRPTPGPLQITQVRASDLRAPRQRLREATHDWTEVVASGRVVRRIFSPHGVCFDVRCFFSFLCLIVLVSFSWCFFGIGPGVICVLWLPSFSGHLQGVLSGRSHVEANVCSLKVL